MRAKHRGTLVLIEGCVSAGATSGIYGTTAQIANAAGVAANRCGILFDRTESVEPTGVASRVGAACTLDHRLAAFLPWMRRVTG
jgi:trans-2-enoyl-CoA reductase